MLHFELGGKYRLATLVEHEAHWPDIKIYKYSYNSSRKYLNQLIRVHCYASVALGMGDVELGNEAISQCKLLLWHWRALPTWLWWERFWYSIQQKALHNCYNMFHYSNIILKITIILLMWESDWASLSLNIQLTGEFSFFSTCHKGALVKVTYLLSFWYKCTELGNKLN